MEFGFASVPDWLLIVLLLVTVIYLYYTWHFGELEQLGIKGPKPWPVIGNVDRWFKYGFVQQDLGLMEQYGKIVGFYEGRMPSIQIADPEILKHIMVKQFSNFINRRHFSLRGVMKYGVLDLTDQHWKDVRSLLTPTFSAGKLKQMTKLIKRNVDSLVTNLEEDAKKAVPTNLKVRTGAYTMDVIASTAFGLDIDSQKDTDNPFIYHAKRIFSLSVFSPWNFIIFFFPFLIPLLEWFGAHIWPSGAIEFFSKVTTAALDERRASNKQDHVDFLKLMLDAEKNMSEADGEEKTEPDHTGFKVDSRRKMGLTTEEIIGQSFLFFIAGYETTATTLMFLMYHLATNPDCQTRLIEEVDDVIQGEEPSYENIQKLPYLQMCIDETLRIYPAVPKMDRRAVEATTIEGLHIPKDMLVILPFWALHRDPEVWPEPEKFDPERFTAENKALRHPYQFMPFGMGPRNCIGMRLALMEMKMAMVKILQKFKFEPCDETPIPIKLQKTFFLNPEKPCIVKVKQRDLPQ